MQNLETVYREHARMVFHFLLILCGEESVAEELTQETFYRAVKNYHTYNGSCKLSTWLCQIAKHLWYQELERRRKRGGGELHENLQSNEPALDENTCFQEDKMELFHKVHILESTAKEVVLLRLTGECSFREIGEIFGKNENWARVTFYRAKQKLQKGGE